MYWGFRNESTIVYFKEVTAGDIAQQYLPTSQVCSTEDESCQESDCSEALENEGRNSKFKREQITGTSSDDTFRELFMLGNFFTRFAERMALKMIYFPHKCLANCKMKP